MEKISISNVVEFRRKKTPTSQVTLINKLKTPKPKKEDAEEGGNYWIHSLSTIANVFKESTNDLILDKINVLLDKQEVANSRQTKSMFQKNIDILARFEEYDFTQFRPDFKLTYLKKPKDKSILVIEDLPIQVLPHHVFIYEEDGIKKISACWFVAKIKEYTFEELAIFTDALYRYLIKNYSEEYKVNPEFCIVIDTMNLNSIRYSEIASGSTLLNSTLAVMKKLFG
ncbi:hypothetical protein HDE69_002016 [Pedobacter cryoconitis]|uniref:Uncharacterized protein n=1 Tax=Pedobacter cryoconitis TaxID=188932 RepID=A0A7W9DJA7_9SPHI|nr:hypothetical protein [Pedobacter cryoconitis]MBB5620963.1 hypothetical protein [Pedobacter cryoconitis]